MKCFVFPLTHANLFPLTTKPLNIFEPRYMQMIKEAIDTNTPVVLAYLPDNGDTYRSIAGYGHPQIIDQRENNTLLVFLSGLSKVKIIREINDASKPFIIAECEPVYEDLNLDENLKPKFMTLSHILVQWVQKHIPDPEQREVFVRSLKGPQEIIGAFAAYLIRDYDLQYEMMEITSLNEQIMYLYRLFESNELST
ncbi:MAG: LON peptidase substrate-binding domain-containing protein [Pseudobdellovibrio sp.]